MPRKCPVCGSPVRKEETVAGGKKSAAHYCTNKDCFAVEEERIIHFVGRKGMDIDGLGEKIVAQLIERGLISDAADLYELKEGDLEGLEGFAEKSAHNLIAAIEKSKDAPLPRFLYALGIRHVGEETAEAIARRFGTIEKVMRAEKDELKAIPGVGEAVAESVYAWMREKKNASLVRRLLRHVRVRKEKTAAEKRGPLAGKTFVLTGALSSMTRDEAKKKIKERGGRVSSSVSRSTDFLVAGKDPGGTKCDAARKLNVPVIGEKELLALISQ